MSNRVLKTRRFGQWMKKTELTDDALSNAVSEMKKGLCDADLGGGVFKKRIPLPGRGKSGSTRTLIATNKNDRWFFIYGFEKKERDNISGKEKEALQKVAGDLLALSQKQIAALVEKGQLQEVSDGIEKQQ